MKLSILLFTIVLNLCVACAKSDCSSAKANWISSDACKNEPNTWLAYQKDFGLTAVPKQAIIRVAVDSKYWLWLNGKIVVREGSLKRGPNPNDTYCDEIDIAPYLKKGENKMSILVCYFGKQGFSHKSSGKAGLFVESASKDFDFKTDSTWLVRMHPAFSIAAGEMVNYRLPESNICFDARKDIAQWESKSAKELKFENAVCMGVEGCAPWGKLVKRPVPMLKDFGLKPYVSTKQNGDILVCKMPHNAQITPYIKLKSPAGLSVEIKTDNNSHFEREDQKILRAEYITKDGVQEFECYGWLNGHNVEYKIPQGVEVLDVKYRESGYNAEFVGKFDCSDAALNTLWNKCARTLYITMRDTYMDCPDRERAQWTGDAVNESGEAFYALSKSSSLLTRKWLAEIVDWQKADGTIYGPVPAGSWHRELPGQSLATVGFFGAWNYYLNSGDKELLKHVYPKIMRYLKAWEYDSLGLLKTRTKDAWVWGDWGKNIDKRGLFNAWYYLALKGMRESALALGKSGDAANFESEMAKLKLAFNKNMWTGKEYRSPDYKELTDDRLQALAVVSGLADKDKYGAIMEIFRTSEHASMYMEKYVFEAMMQMGYEKEAIARHKKRFKKELEDAFYTTLPENWYSGTRNHAWSGGGLTILAQYVCGVAPTKAGYAEFEVIPMLGDLQYASLEFESVKGFVKMDVRRNAMGLCLKVSVPKGSSAILGIPESSKISLNNKMIFEAGKFANDMDAGEPMQGYRAGYVCVKVPSGDWTIESK